VLWQLLRSAFTAGSSARSLVAQALVCRGSGRLQDAERTLRSAVSQFPRDADVLTNLAIVLLEQDQAQEAAELLQRALAADPGFAPAHFNFANLLRANGRLAEAIEHYRAAKSADASLVAAPEELMYALLETCDWDGARVEADELCDRVARSTTEEWLPFVSPLTALYLGLNADQCKAAAAHRAHQDARGVKQAPTTGGAATTDRAQRASDKRIRIAYFSRDFRDHPVAHLLRGAFALHDRSRFEVHAYSFGPQDGSEYRREIAASVDRFVDISAATDDEAAAVISAARIDLLVDLMGHTTGNRLAVLARRPAPVQAHYLGYGGTTGAEWIDYFIGDDVVTPCELEPLFTEELVRVPNCFMMADGTEALSAPPTTRAAHGLPENACVYANFGNASRIDQATFALWMQILEAVPSGVLWLRRVDALAESNLKRAAESHHVDPQRIIFSERVPDKAMHFARLGLADLALDTIGWHNGHSTTADMLWAGVPVLTAPGATFATRVAASLVHAAGATELVVRDAEEYVATAVALGRNRLRALEAKRKLLAARTSAPFFDTAWRIRDLETAYLALLASHSARDVRR
jgi:protein O-GlcNAc transferase